MKLLALDGNSLAYRAYFALPEEAMTTSDGQPTNAVVGFVNMLLRMLREREPDLVVVTWDVKTPQFRLDIDPDYKGQRDETPTSLGNQLNLIRELVDALRIPMIAIEGAEADDVLATLAVQGRAAGMTVEIVSGDRDIFQCVHDPDVTVLYTKRGISEIDEMDEAAVQARYGVGPSDYPSLAALRGDNSDNLPGVPGIGDKTAAKLLTTYGDLAGIIANVDKLTPKQRENVAASWDRVERNHRIMVLETDVELPLKLTELEIGEWDVDRIVRVYKTLEFGPSILGRTLDFAEKYGPADGGGGAAAAASPSDQPDVTVDIVKDGDAFVAAVEALDMPRAFAMSGPSGVAGVPELWAAASADGSAVVADGRDVALAEVGRFVSGPEPSFVGHATKDLITLLATDGIDVRGLDLDTEIAAYLLDPAPGSYPLAQITEKYLRVELVSPDRPAQGELALGATGDEEREHEDAGRCAWAAAALAPELRKRLETNEMAELYDTVERPTTRILAHLEALGIKVDVEYLDELSVDLTQRINTLEHKVYDHAGREFTLNSPKQLQQVLFDELGLPVQKKTKTGRSTDAETLEALRDHHPIAEALLEWRNLEKLRSTYTDALPPLVDPADGRIHTRFKQTGAATGRLASDTPNLMNIPIRTDEGRKIRRAFIPEAGWKLCSADYSQIELRVMAHLSGDEGLLEAFSMGDDIHAATAARVFGVPLEDVTSLHRSRAKVVNYGLLYGMQTWGLASRMGIEREEAQAFIDRYFTQFPALAGFMEATVEGAKERGYTATMFGRKRWFPELRSRNPRFRQMGERQALNAPIQGTAADIVKIAMIRLDEALDAAGLRTRMLLQVHDEIVLEVPEDEVEEAGPLVEEVMSSAVELAVPLVVDAHFGASWADCKD